MNCQDRVASGSWISLTLRHLGVHHLIQFDFDSTPPAASILPSGLKANEVTERPIVPADIVPIMSTSSLSYRQYWHRRY